jgi:hypothetical protein
VHNAHLHTLAPQVEVANSVVWRCNRIEVRKNKANPFFPTPRPRPRKAQDFPGSRVQSSSRPCSHAGLDHGLDSRRASCQSLASSLPALQAGGTPSRRGQHVVSCPGPNAQEGLPQHPARRRGQAATPTCLPQTGQPLGVIVGLRCRTETHPPQKTKWTGKLAAT